MFVVGEHGDVGSRLVDLAADAGHAVRVVSRDSSTRRERPSLPWTDLPAAPASQTPQPVV